MINIYALTQFIRGNYQTRQVRDKPLDTYGLLSLTEPILDDCQLVFWYPKELSYETAKWLAKDFAVDLKRDLSDYTK